MNPDPKTKQPEKWKRDEKWWDDKAEEVCPTQDHDELEEDVDAIREKVDEWL